VVERDDVATDAGIGTAALLELGLFGVQRGVGGIAGLAGERLLDLCRHVADLGQLIELECVTLPLFRGGLGGETGFDEVLLGRRQRLDTVDDAVMVGHDQALRRDERGGAAHRDPQRRGMHVIEPRLRRREAGFCGEPACHIRTAAAIDGS
jgi:hypothetical protein